MAKVSVSELAGQHLYLDANIFIYAIERHPDFLARVDSLFTRIDAGEITATTSELTIADCLVKPFADNDIARQGLYQAAISPRQNFSVVAISRAILIQAAQLRALHKVRLPDAVHLATATASACQALITNDQLIRPISGIPVIQLVDLNV